MDNDSKMIKTMSDAIINLQVKYRASPVMDRMQIRPSLEELIRDFSNYQMRLLKEGIITNEADLEDMAQIKSEIDAAANKQQLIESLGRTIAFVALKI